MFRSTMRRLGEAPQLTIRNNPYKAQKEWPPDFTKLNPKYQFRLERRYRRRAKLRYSRPQWTKAVKLAASGSSFLILVYGVLFMDWGEMAGRDVKPFEGIREWVRKQISSIWTANSTSFENPAQESDIPPKPLH
ncbi:MAG: hypothetical protein ASARMPRED_008842 [Alectoria sarmentosa]|nr:MAG: hypothetical protein ASARMPRED_008842 [Alectoria sarmentosa]